MIIHLLLLLLNKYFLGGELLTHVMILCLTTKIMGLEIAVMIVM